MGVLESRVGESGVLLTFEHGIGIESEHEFRRITGAKLKIDKVQEQLRFQSSKIDKVQEQLRFQSSKTSDLMLKVPVQSDLMLMIPVQSE